MVYPTGGMAYPNALMVIDKIWGVIEKRLTKVDNPTHALDTSACGDFTLMHKEDWLKIDGYVELDLYSIHIDSMALMAANALGIKQVIFPFNYCIYHIYHKDGWEAIDTPIEMIKFITKRPGLDWASVFEASNYIITNKIGWGLNSADWGFAKHNFQEISINSPE